MPHAPAFVLYPIRRIVPVNRLASGGVAQRIVPLSIPESLGELHNVAEMQEPCVVTDQGRVEADLRLTNGRVPLEGNESSYTQT